MATCFRIRFVLAESSMISSTKAELVLPDPDGKTITLTPAERDQPLNEAKQIALLGSPFDSPGEATAAAECWAGRLKKVFARLNVAADFGDRAAHSFLAKAGLDMLKSQNQDRILDDVHGIMVFECKPTPMFGRIEPVRGIVGPGEERLLATIEKAVEIGAVMTGQEQLAYDLYAASPAGGSPDARFVMLMMAVETLIDSTPRTNVVRAHVKRLIAETKQAGLPKSEAASLTGSLEHMLSESIGQAGRKLAAKLGDRRYMDGTESPVKFFTKCYDLRSALVHGHDPRPSRETVGGRAATLERFVADLLSLEYGN
jgi:hypothetical protein